MIRRVEQHLFYEEGLRELGLFILEKRNFYYEGGETLAQVAQRGSGGPIPRNVRGYVGQDSEQHGVVE